MIGIEYLRFAVISANVLTYPASAYVYNIAAIASAYCLISVILGVMISTFSFLLLSSPIISYFSSTTFATT